MVMKKTSLALLAAAGMAMSSAAMAQGKGDKGWYLGATFGQSSMDLEDCGGGVDCDDEDTAWRILGGYQVNRNFAIEVGYHELGTATQSIPGLATLDFKANAFELLAVGMLPINNQFSLYGKAGIYRGEVKATLNVLGSSDSLKETNTDLTFGFGAQFNVTRELGLRAEWQRYTSMGDNATIGESDVDVMSLGLVYRFQ